MTTEVIRIDAGGDISNAVGRAVRMLAEGAVVAFPTETVYGVGVRADRQEAVARLRQLKSRPEQKAFTVHIGARDRASHFAPSIPERAKHLIRKAWPGPLTLILSVDAPGSAPIARRVDADALLALYYDNTVGLRCPDHAVAEALLTAVDGPVVAASANRAGAPPPYDAHAVRENLDGAIDLLIDAGPTRFRKPSSIVRCSAARLDVVREGVLDSRIIERLSQVQVLFVCTGNTCRSPMAEGLARKMIADRLNCDVDGLATHGISVRSAGTSGGFGAVSEHAVEVLRGRGVDISQHQSAAVSADAMNRADYVFAMTRNHVEDLKRIASSAADRVQLLLGTEDVTDPVGGSQDDYERCAEKIEQGLKQRLAEVDLL